MIPTKLLFLYLFLPVSVLVYHFSRQMRRKNLVLIGISLLLYTFEQPAYIAVMVALSYVNYRMAFRIDPEEPKTLWIPVIINIVILAGFKYLSSVVFIM